MKQQNKIIFFGLSLAVLVTGGIFFTVSKAEAGSVKPDWGPYRCVDTTGGGSNNCQESFSQGAATRQIWGYDTTGTQYQDFESGLVGGNEHKLTLCFGFDYRVLWQGPCKISEWNTTLAGVPHNVYQDWPLGVVSDDIGNIYDAEHTYNYLTVNERVNDAEISGHFYVWERWVENLSTACTDGCSTNPKIGDNFTVGWDTDQALGGVVLSWSGTVGSGTQDVPDDGSMLFTCSEAGDTTFTTVATGPGGSGPTTASNSTTVTCESASGGGGSNTSTINVISNQSTCWIISGTDPSFPNSSCNPPKTYTVVAGNYSISADDLTCYTKEILPSANQSVASGQSITFSINYTYTCGGPPPPPPPGSFVCSPSTQNVNVNVVAYFSASGGTGSYSWSASGGSPSSGSSSSFSTQYATAGSKTVTVSSGGLTASCGVNVTSTSVPPCLDNASIAVNISIPATVQPGQTIQTKYTVTDSGGTRWYHGDAYRFVQNGSSIGIVDPSTSLNYGHLPFGAYPGDPISWTFTVTAPTTPGTYTLRMQMVHKAGWVYRNPDGSTCAAPASDIFFGPLSSQTFTVQSIPAAVLGFNIVYTPKPLQSGALALGQTCNGNTSTVNLSWTYTANGAEDGFNIYRSTDSTSWTLVKNVGATVRSTTDTPPPNVRYYYWIRTHRILAIDPRESTDPSGQDKKDIFVNPCVANLVGSTKTLTKVNNIAFSPTVQLKAGDVLTYEIAIVNSGSAPAAVSYICDNPTANLGNFRNLLQDGVAKTITTSDATCISQGNSGLRFNISGTLSPGSTWRVSFEATLSSTPSAAEAVCNSAVIYYNDNGLKSKAVSAPCAITTPKQRAPDFDEIAP